LRFPDFKTIDT